MNLPKEYSDEKSKYVIIPIEYEKDVTYGKGASNGAKEIIKASKHLEYYDEQFDIEGYTNGIRVLEPLNLMNEEPKKAMKIISEKVREQKEKFIIGVGGDHAVTTSLINGIEDDFDVIVLDAHADLRYSWNNSKLNHACVCRRLCKKHGVGVIGTRSMDTSEKEFLEENKNAYMIKAYEYDENKLNELLSKLKDKVYVSIDVDVFDPSFIRNTGTPEPGGFFWNDIINILKIIFKKKSIIGCDVVEFAPTQNFESEAYSLAKLIYKIICLNENGKKRNY